MLRTKSLTLGLAESVTGGLVAARLTDIPGASDVLRGSIVSYATDVKQQLLDVPEGPVVSEEAALAMARGASKVVGSDVTMALTGVAGPTEQDGMPVGTLCVAIVWPDGELTRTFRLPGQRQQMRQFSVINSLDLLRKMLSP
jgi:nicotinamide-nucleotide amidase